MKNTILLDMNSITDISDTLLKYKDNENIERMIDLKESASVWWEKYHKETLLSKIMRKKQKCRYAGNKEFRIGEISYIEFYTKNEQMRLSYLSHHSAMEYYGISDQICLIIFKRYLFLEKNACLHI